MQKNSEKNYTSKKDTRQIPVRISPCGGPFIDRRRFDRLLLSLSARCKGPFSNGLDREIEKGLKDVAEYFKVDRIILWEFPHNGQEGDLIQYRSEVNVQPALKTLVYNDLPYIMGHIKKREVIPVSCIDDLPASADIDRQTIQRHGVKSFLAVPLFVSGAPLGALFLSLKRAEHRWSYEDIMQVQRIGEIIAILLDRKRTAEALRESERRLKDITFSIGDWVWEVDENGVYTYSSSKGFDIFGDIIGKTPFDSMPPDEAKRVGAIFSEIAANKSPIKDLENWNIGKNGERICLLTNAVPILDKEGNLKGYRGVDKDITERKKTEEELRKSYDEIVNLKEKLRIENIYLRQDLNMPCEHDNLIGQSDAMKYVFFRIQQVAQTNSTVLITGETGTGKGMVARAIHKASSRRNQLMVTVNCASLPGNLIESELFGREKGAFTGAHTAQIGRFELADKGTIFLDEIGELPLELQAKLLRVLEDGEFERLGSPHSIKVDVRIIASTNRDLSKEIQERRFREDLFYRLNVFPITVPPIRQRKEDIPLLVQNFVEIYSKRMGKQITSVPQEVIYALQKYPWPGNVRELENIIERSVIGSPGHVLRVADLIMAPHSEYQINSEENITFTPATQKDLTATQSLFYAERNHILKTLERTGWRIEGINGAAEMLGLKPSTLRSRMKKLGIHKTINN